MFIAILAAGCLEIQDVITDCYKILVNLYVSRKGVFSMSSIQEILDRTQKRIDEIGLMKDKVYIVNAGTTNNGKSSTFNSLLMLEGKRELGQNVFKVQDVRTTVENQEAEYHNGVYLMDTPGLDRKSVV